MVFIYLIYFIWLLLFWFFHVQTGFSWFRNTVKISYTCLLRQWQTEWIYNGQQCFSQSYHFQLYETNIVCLQCMRILLTVCQKKWWNIFLLEYGETRNRVLFTIFSHYFQPRRGLRQICVVCAGLRRTSGGEGRLSSCLCMVGRGGSSLYLLIHISMGGGCFCF